MLVKLKEIKHFPIKVPLNHYYQKPHQLRYLMVMIMLLFCTTLTYAQNYKEFTAKSGDGIYSVLRENNISLSYVNKFIELNKGKLGKDNQLLTGVKYRLPIADTNTPQIKQEKEQTTPSTKITRRFPIFGDKYQDIEIESSELNGAVFYLVGGHGGPDPGAVATYQGKILCEDEYAYDITLRLARCLLTQGATVYMITRDNNDGIRDGWYLPADKDEKCYPNLTIPLNQNARLKQRRDAINKLYKKYKGQYQRVLVLHVDSRSKGEKIDVFFYYDKRSASGKKLANNLRNTFDKKYNQYQPGRGYHGSVSARNLFMLKYTWPVATFTELGNINHQRDLKRFIIEDNRQALANWLAEGLILDFKNSKK